MGKKQEISLMNIIFCLLVIFIHILSAPVGALDKSSIQYAAVLVPWRLSAFVVQGFIFLSGLKLFLTSDRKTNYKKYYLSRFNKIVLPYVLWVVIFYLYFVKHDYFSFELSALLKYIANGTLVSHFYFVITIVQFYLLLPVWKAFVKNIRPGYGITAAAVIMLASMKYLPEAILKIIGRDFVYNDRIFTTYIIYWIAGCYAGVHYQNLYEWINKKTLCISMVYICVASVEAVLVWLDFSGRQSFGFLDELHIIYSLSAILFFFSMSTHLGDRVMGNSLAKIINNSSYYIYLIHPLLIYIIDDEMFKRGIIDQGTATVVRTIFVYVGSVALCGLYIRLKGFIRGKNK